MAVVRARWSCCARLLWPSCTLGGAAVSTSLLTIDRPSYGPAWGSAWYPGEAPGEACSSWLNGISFPFLTFLGGCTLSPMSVVFPKGVFTRLRVLTRHPRTWGFTVISLLSLLFSAALPYDRKCPMYGSRASLGLPSRSAQLRPDVIRWRRWQFATGDAASRHRRHLDRR